MRKIFFPLCLLATLAAGPTHAAPPWKGDSPARAHPAGGSASLADAVDRVKTSTGGRIIGASQSIDRTGRPVYLVRVLMPNGVVRTMRVPSH